MLHVGRICEEKMQAYSVDVLRLLLDACPDLVLVFAGDGTLRIVDDRVRHRCFFLGITPRAELAYLYSFSQFLLYPSSWGEGCTVVPFEALASGTQFVCIAKGCGADELLAHTSNAFLFDALSEREALLQFIKKTYAARTHIEPYGFDYLDRTVYAQRFMETGHLCTLAHR
jgi:glycosyltransferase involved in cell wall biosynthesis